MGIAALRAEEDFDGNRLLAPYATNWRTSKGRRFDEPAALDRTPFQRDRDRVVHSDAFRRLQYKTQVFVNFEEDDHFRTRLTHSLEVAQVTRTMCRALGLDEDLGEVIALSHDLGHPPFGHAGEEALNEAMHAYGGWRHNEQTIRIVRDLEIRYGHFDGLNLTWEALEGIAKHNGPLHRGIPPCMSDLEPDTYCGLEGQVAALADDIAYNHHDLDDGLRAGALHLNQVRQLSQFERAYTEVIATYPQADNRRVIKETIRRMLGRQIRDVLAATRAKLSKVKPKDANAVRCHGEPLVLMPAEVLKETQAIKEFLMEHMYRHYLKNRTDFRGRQMVEHLFEAFFNHKRLMPDYIQARLPKDTKDDAGKALVISDYIAMMTDRSAAREHARLFGTSGRQGFNW